MNDEKIFLVEKDEDFLFLKTTMGFCLKMVSECVFFPEHLEKVCLFSERVKVSF